MEGEKDEAVWQRGNDGNMETVLATFYLWILSLFSFLSLPIYKINPDRRIANQVLIRLWTAHQKMLIL